jgi:hypothetical protein
MKPGWRLTVGRKPPKNPWLGKQEIPSIGISANAIDQKAASFHNSFPNPHNICRFGD